MMGGYIYNISLSQCIHVYAMYFVYVLQCIITQCIYALYIYIYIANGNYTGLQSKIPPNLISTDLTANAVLAQVPNEQNNRARLCC